MVHPLAALLLACSPSFAEGSVASSPHVVVGVLEEIRKTLRATDARWTYPKRGPTIDSLERAYDEASGELPRVRSLGIYKSKVQTGGQVDQINAFLAENKLTITLQPASSERAVAAAAVVDMKVKWAVKGESARFDGDTNTPAFMLLRENVDVFSANGQMVYSPRLEAGALKLYVSPFSGTLQASDLSAAQKAAKILSTSKSPAPARECSAGIVLPMVSLSRRDKGVEALKENATLTVDGKPWVIEQFELEQKFSMDELGATATAGAAGVATERSIAFPCEALGNVLVWFEADGVIPFAALVTAADFKDPKAVAAPASALDRPTLPADATKLKAVGPDFNATFGQFRETEPGSGAWGSKEYLDRASQLRRQQAQIAALDLPLAPPKPRRRVVAPVPPLVKKTAAATASTTLEGPFDFLFKPLRAVFNSPNPNACLKGTDIACNTGEGAECGPCVYPRRR